MEPFAPLMDFAKWLNEPVKEKGENKMEKQENWHGKVTVTAKLVLDYEFDDDILADDMQEAQKNGLEMFCEDIIEIAWTDPNDLASWIKETAEVTAEKYEDR